MKIIQIIAGLLIALFGLGLFGWGMLRLGWGVHGKSLLDFSFLHLDWIFQRDLPYWRAHMGNLGRDHLPV